MPRRVPTTAPGARMPKDVTATPIYVPPLVDGSGLRAVKDSTSRPVAASAAPTGAMTAPSRDLNAALGSGQNTLRKVR